MNVKKKKTKRKRLFRFIIGQLVRISHQRRAFIRAYNEQWSYEVFRIKRRFQMQGIPIYTLVDLLESEIKGNFYHAELQSVNKSENTLWEVDKILRNRQRNNRKELLAKWTGYSNRFNSWVDEADIKNVYDPRAVMMSASFYLVVDSDDSKNLEYYPENQPWKFKVRFDAPLNLCGFWTVALTEIVAKQHT